MRLFLAVCPSPAATAHLSAALGPAAAGGDGGWHRLPPAQWHLTVVFLGEVGPQRLPELAARLREAAGRCRPFALRLAGAGSFGGRRAAGRVLWMGVAGDRDALVRLVGQTVGAVRAAGVPVPERPYRPHLTVARSRSSAAAAEPGPHLTGYLGPPWTVSELRLVHSRLERPVRHELVQSFRLLPAGHQAAGHQAANHQAANHQAAGHQA